jgi:hypothetical protein
MARIERLRAEQTPWLCRGLSYRRFDDPLAPIKASSIRRSVKSEVLVKVMRAGAEASSRSLPGDIDEDEDGVVVAWCVPVVRQWEVLVGRSVYIY